MKSRDHKHKVQDMLQSSLRRDKAKTNILSISPIGVVEMTRQRMRKSLESATYKKCPYCLGRGLVKSDTTVTMQILRKIERASHTSKRHVLNVKINPQIHKYIKENERNLVIPLQKRCRKRVIFLGDASLGLEDTIIE